MSMSDGTPGLILGPVNFVVAAENPRVGVKKTPFGLKMGNLFAKNVGKANRRTE